VIAVRVFRARWQAFRNTLLPRHGRRRSRRTGPSRAAAVLGLVLGLLSFAVVRELIGLLVSGGGGLHDAALAVAAIVNLTLVGLLVFDLHEGLSALLVDSDIDLLRRAPLGPASLLVLKLFDALPRTSLMLAVLVTPALFAFHAMFPLPGWSWLLVPVQLVALWATPLGLGIAGSLVLLRHVPARHAREALGLMSTLTLFALWMVNSFLLPRVGEPATSLSEVRVALARMSDATAPLPGAWMGHALERAVRGDVLHSLAATAMLLGYAAASVLVAVAVAKRDLEAVQTRILGGGMRHTGRVRARRPPRATGARSLLGAMITRDGVLLARHWTILGDLLVTAVLWTLLPIVVSPLFETSRPTLARAMLLALTVAIGNEIGARTLPLERGALAWARLAPNPPWRWLACRLASAGALAAVLLAIAAAGTARALDLDAGEIGALLAVVVPALGLALATGVWAGATFGDPRWTNPRAMLAPAGRVVSTLLLLVQGAAWLGLSGLAAVEHSGAVRELAVPIAATVAAALALVAFTDAARRLGRADLAEA